MDPQGAMYVYATINHGGRSYTDKRTKFSNTLMWVWCFTRSLPFSHSKDEIPADQERCRFRAEDAGTATGESREGLSIVDNDGTWMLARHNEYAAICCKSFRSMRGLRTLRQWLTELPQSSLLRFKSVEDRGGSPQCLQSPCVNVFRVRAAIVFITYHTSPGALSCDLSPGCSLHTVNVKSVCPTKWNYPSSLTCLTSYL